MPNIAAPRAALGVAAPVLDRFPAHAEAVEKLLSESESFRSLCQDLALAIQAVRRFSAQRQPGDATRMAEYATLVEELEREIAGLIGAPTVPVQHVKAGSRL